MIFNIGKDFGYGVTLQYPIYDFGRHTTQTQIGEIDLEVVRLDELIKENGIDPNFKDIDQFVSYVIGSATRRLMINSTTPFYIDEPTFLSAGESERIEKVSESVYSFFNCIYIGDVRIYDKNLRGRGYGSMGLGRALHYIAESSIESNRTCPIIITDIGCKKSEFDTPLSGEEKKKYIKETISFFENIGFRQLNWVTDNESFPNLMIWEDVERFPVRARDRYILDSFKYVRNIIGDCMSKVYRDRVNKKKENNNEGK